MPILAAATAAQELKPKVLQSMRPCAEAGGIDAVGRQPVGVARLPGGTGWLGHSFLEASEHSCRFDRFAEDAKHVGLTYDGRNGYERRGASLRRLQRPRAAKQPLRLVLVKPVPEQRCRGCADHLLVL